MTTKLLLGNQDKKRHETMHKGPSNFARDLAMKTSDNLGEFMARQKSITTLDKDLQVIFDEAIKLDLKINRQAARVEYSFNSGAESYEFDEAQLQLEHGENPPLSAPTITMVLAPSFSKRGQSSGEKFNSFRILVPMKVTSSLPHSSVQRVEQEQTGPASGTRSDRHKRT